MPCKHEGGTDKCDQYTSGGHGCREQQRLYRIATRERAKSYRHANRDRKRLYDQTNLRRNGAAYDTLSDRGAAGEHLVISECLTRHLPTGGPYNQNGKHDLFVFAGGAWRTVQVKIGRVNTKTGAIYRRNGLRGITSDLIAMVDLEDKRIRWISNTDGPIPPELL